jgi:hypothetical protein
LDVPLLIFILLSLGDQVMVAQVIRNVFSDKLSTKYQGIVQNLANKAPIPIRHFDFKFNPAELDQKFFLNKELATSYFHALSIFLTFGEDVVIEQLVIIVNLLMIRF